MDETPHCYRHPNRETLVSCSECGRPICEDCMSFAPVGIRCPDHANIGAPKPDARRTVRQVQHRATSSGIPVTLGILSLNIIVYLVSVSQGRGISEPGGTVFEKGALWGFFIRVDGEWWRLVTAMFLHGSLIHLLLNMFALYWIGSAVEHALGAWRYLLLYFVSGIAGSAGALLLSEADKPTVGASGAIYGLLGALLILEYLSTGSFAGQAMTIIVINLALTFAIPNISIGGHLGGLVGGIAVTYILAKTRYKRNRLLGPALVAGVLVLSVVIAYVRVKGYGPDDCLSQGCAAVLEALRQR